MVVHQTSVCKKWYQNDGHSYLARAAKQTKKAKDSDEKLDRRLLDLTAADRFLAPGLVAQNLPPWPEWPFDVASTLGSTFAVFIVRVK